MPRMRDFHRKTNQTLTGEKHTRSYTRTHYIGAV